MKIPKGTKDTLPSEQIIRNRMLQILREVFERYGFRPLDTPAFELFSVLSAKYAGGGEILKETFSFKDRGNRKLGLRYDLTVPLARFIALNPQLKLPFKRYQIGKVWRDGPTGFARYREFWQCDVDTVGSSSMNADAEILTVAQEVFKTLGLKAEIKVNNRKLLNGIMEKLKVAKKLDAILVIDKLEKCSDKELLLEFAEKGIMKSAGKAILQTFRLASRKGLGFLSQLIEGEEGKLGLIELQQLLRYLKSYGVKVAFAPQLARGLSYYTSTIFEVFVSRNKVESSVAGGGRYDNMIGKFAGTKQSLPAVGISFGLDRIYDALSFPNPPETSTIVFVIPLGTEPQAIQLAQSLRRAGINTETDIGGKGISKNLKYANSLGIPYVVFLGKDELNTGKFKLREMKTGRESLLTREKLVERLKKG